MNLANLVVTLLENKVVKKRATKATAVTKPVEEEQHTVKVVVENKPVIGDGEAIIEEAVAE